MQISRCSHKNVSRNCRLTMTGVLLCLMKCYSLVLICPVLAITVLYGLVYLYLLAITCCLLYLTCEMRVSQVKS